MRLIPVARLALYQGLAKGSRNLAGVEQIAGVIQKIAPGEPPATVENLLYIVKIKTLAARAGVESISRGKMVEDSYQAEKRPGKSIGGGRKRAWKWA